VLEHLPHLRQKLDEIDDRLGRIALRLDHIEIERRLELAE
jgi:hypothetical protein